MTAWLRPSASQLPQHGKALSRVRCLKRDKRQSILLLREQGKPIEAGQGPCDTPSNDRRGLIPSLLIWPGLSDLLYQKKGFSETPEKTRSPAFWSAHRPDSHHYKEFEKPLSRRHAVKEPMVTMGTVAWTGREMLSQVPADEAISAQTAITGLRMSHLGCPTRRSGPATLAPAKS